MSLLAGSMGLFLDSEFPGTRDRKGKKGRRKRRGRRGGGAAGRHQDLGGRKGGVGDGGGRGEVEGEGK